MYLLCLLCIYSTELDLRTHFKNTSNLGRTYDLNEIVNIWCIYLKVIYCFKPWYTSLRLPSSTVRLFSLQVISHCERKHHPDIHRFEKISNIIKQFKLSCSKLAATFQGMEVSNKNFSAFIDVFTSNTYVMVVMSDPTIRKYPHSIRFLNGKAGISRNILNEYRTFFSYNVWGKMCRYNFNRISKGLHYYVLILHTGINYILYTISCIHESL